MEEDDLEKDGLKTSYLTTVKSKPAKEQNPKSSLVERNIPLLIADVHKIPVNDGFESTYTINGVQFKTLMIYGRAVPLKIQTKRGIRLYTVDDGTQTITVHYSHSKQEIRNTSCTVNRLSTELDVAKKNGIPLLGTELGQPGNEACKELIKDLEVILNVIKRRTYLPELFFKHGAKVSVVGVPYKPNKDGPIHIWAFEMIEDSSQNRDKEIFFKKTLINFYKNKFNILSVS